MAEASGPSQSASAMRGLFGRDALYLGLWVGQAALAALLTPVTTRILGQREFGSVVTAMAVMQLLSALCVFGLQTAAQRVYAEPGGLARARRLVAFAASLAVLIMAAVYATGTWWAPRLGLGSFPATVRYAVLWGGAVALTGPALALLRSADRLRMFALVTLVQSIFAEALAVTIVLAHHRYASAYVFGQLAAQVVAASVALAAIRPARPIHGDWTLITSSMRFAAGLVPGLIAGFVVNASDRLIIQADLGPKAVARYGVASNLGGLTIMALTMLDFIWLPRLFAISDVETRRDVLSQMRTTLSVLVTSLVLVNALASPLLLWLWAPPSFQPHHLLLVTALAAVAAVPLCQAQVYMQALIIRGKTTAVAVANCVCAVANLGLNVALVPKLGLDGSAAITFACFGLLALATYFLARGDVVPMRLSAFAALVTATGLIIASAAIPPTGLALAIRLALAACAALAFFATLLRLLRPEKGGRLLRPRSAPATVD